MPTEDNYPTDEELALIENWSYEDMRGWFAYIKSVGNYWSDEAWGWSEEDSVDELLNRPIRIFYISTGGWSGNESILAAMKKNFINWSFTWYEARRGGHYTFYLPVEKTPDAEPASVG